MHTRKPDLLQGWGEHGLDNVYKSGNDYYIIEAKYGSSTLQMTNDGMQLSDTWIFGSNRLKNAVNNPAIEADIKLKGYKRILANISPDGTVNFQEVDALGDVIGSISL